MYYTTNYSSPLGSILLASDGENLIGAWLAGQKYHGGALKDEAVQKDDLPVFTRAKNWLDRYFNGDKPAISALPLAPVGGEFRQTVWNILREIPYGETLTYGDIARLVAAQTGKKRVSAQAVGGAVGHNPISIIIPCHRVVGASGSLTGYAGGIDKKIKLLKHEAVDTSSFFVPPNRTGLFSQFCAGFTVGRRGKPV
ncbi:MAG: methylated-DNA--[protein]-cysteine S-methyltransferase [Planctomycetota bacterium]|nr:methylated-DNA--[protein]-cysteine S-methyltransferase [Planctomycetota bacterium]